MDILYFIFSVILVETITQLITKSEIFKPVRKFFFYRRKNKVSHWIHALLDCGYCTSVWVGWFVAVIFCLKTGRVSTLNIFLLGLIFHRLSNVLHFIIDWIDEKRSREYDFIEKENE